MSVLERAIEAVSPGWAARRGQARAQIAASRAQAAASRTAEQLQVRRGERFRFNEPGKRDLTAPGARKAMSNVDLAAIRALFRVNPFARKLRGTLLNNLVAYGITATPKGSKKLQKEWSDWIAHADHDGVSDFYGLQELAVWTRYQDGECFIVLRIVSPSTVNPLRLQVLRADQLDRTLAANNVRDGVEYGDDGRPVAYHFRTAVDELFGLEATSKSERIPAEQVIHHFRREEAGQWRGRSPFEPVADVLTDIDDYLEAEGVRKKLESCFVAMVTDQPDSPSETLGSVDGEASGGLPAESLYPGMISYLGSKTVTFGEPKAAGGLGEFMRWGALRAAAGGEVTYEGLTGDLSNVNFSSFRAGKNEFQRYCARDQWLCVIPQICTRVQSAWLEAGWATGRIGDRDRNAEFKWTPPVIETISRVDDANADILEMQAGLGTRREKLAERGLDHDQVVAEIASDTAATKKLKIAFKGDPYTPGQTSSEGGGDAADDGSAAAS